MLNLSCSNKLSRKSPKIVETQCGYYSQLLLEFICKLSTLLGKGKYTSIFILWFIQQFFKFCTSLRRELDQFKNLSGNVKYCVKSVRIRSYSGTYFLAFGLNTDRYGVFLRIQSKCGKMRTRITPNMETFYAVKYIPQIFIFS